MSPNRIQEQKNSASHIYIYIYRYICMHSSIIHNLPVIQTPGSISNYELIKRCQKIYFLFESLANYASIWVVINFINYVVNCGKTKQSN